MEIIAKYVGRCQKCNGRVIPGQRIIWDRETSRVWHIQCPPAESAQPNAESPSSQRRVLYNRRGGSCNICGHYLQPGEGRLERCIEDSGCSIHHDESGWHVYCVDEGGCQSRRDEARRVREREQARATERDALLAALRASATERYGIGSAEQVRIPEGAVLIGERHALGGGVYRSWYAVPGAVIYRSNSGAASESWRAPASAEQVARLKELLK